MIKDLKISRREKILFIIAGVALVFILIGLIVNANRLLWKGVAERKATLLKQWQYSSMVLERGPSIEAELNSYRERAPRLFEVRMDLSQSMVELDGVAKTSGVQVDLIKPVQKEGAADHFELSLRGSWNQIIGFISAIEGPDGCYKASSIHIVRRENTKELFVSAELSKRTFN